MPKPRFSGGRAVITRPSNSTDPVSGDSSPAMIRRVVVLPQPDGPSKPKNSPRSTAIETSATAAVAPKRLEISLRERSDMQCLAFRSTVLGAVLTLVAQSNPRDAQSLISTSLQRGDISQSNSCSRFNGFG